MSTHEHSSGVTPRVRTLHGGRITIPADLRRQLGIEDDSQLQVFVSGGDIHLRPLEAGDQMPGSPWLRELYREFAQVREEAEGYCSEEIDRSIDDSIRAVR